MYYVAIEFIVYFVMFIVYFVMTGVTIWIGGKIGSNDNGDVVAGFCWLWPITLPVVFGFWIYHKGECSRKRRLYKWTNKQ